MKKALSYIIILLTIGAFTWSQASVLFFQAAQHIHYKMERTLSTKNKFRDTITIASADEQKLVWFKKDEIRYRGRMFDVKRKLHCGDKLLLVGHYDTKDDQLLSVIFTRFDDNAPATTGENRHIIKMLAIEAVVNSPTPAVTGYLSANKKKPGVRESPGYSYSEVNKCFRPPRLSCS